MGPDLPQIEQSPVKWRDDGFRRELSANQFFQSPLSETHANIYSSERIICEDVDVWG